MHLSTVQGFPRGRPVSSAASGGAAPADPEPQPQRKVGVLQASLRCLQMHPGGQAGQHGWLCKPLSQSACAAAPRTHRRHPPSCPPACPPARLPDRPTACLPAGCHPLQVPVYEQELLKAYLAAAAAARWRAVERTRVDLKVAASEFLQRLEWGGLAAATIFCCLSRVQQQVPELAGTGMGVALAAAGRSLVWARFGVVAALMVAITVLVCGALVELISAALAYLQARRNTLE